MSDYTPPPGAERFAEMVHRQQVESDQQRRRLEDAPTDQVKRVLRDRDEPLTARANALLVLFTRRDPEMPDLLLALFDDPEPDLWLAAIRSYCPPDPRIIERLREMLDDPRDRAWSEAACALARLRDGSVLPRLLDWLEGGDEPHRNVAIEGLTRLETADAHRHLVEAWERGGRGEGERVVLAVALLRRGDERGLTHLEDIARRADGGWSVVAATWFWHNRRAHGLELMKHILDHGTLEAQRSMVNQVWNFTQSPHAFTADGIHEARCWVEQELQGSSTSGLSLPS